MQGQELNSCGATRLGTCVPSQRIQIYAEFDNGVSSPARILRFPLALRSPFTSVFRTAFPPPAALWDVPQRLLTLPHRFPVFIYTTGRPECQPVILRIFGGPRFPSARRRTQKMNCPRPLKIKLPDPLLDPVRVPLEQRIRQQVPGCLKLRIRTVLPQRLVHRRRQLSVQPAVRV